MAMDDRIRTSDADRERVTARLREHFAEGRLTREELDERVTAALNARTYGDLRRIMADLPGPGPGPGLPQPQPWGTAGGPVLVRRGPGIMPLVALLFLAAVLFPVGPWVFFGFFHVLLTFLLVLFAVRLFAAARFRRRMRRQLAQGPGQYWGWPG
jgi:hypothetical protein